MIFKSTVFISASELSEKYKDVKPLYKMFGDDLTDDINWIHTHKSMIVGAVCENIWKLYYRDFIDQMILSKYRFYKLIEKELNVSTKVIRISQDNIKRCFIE